MKRLTAIAFATSVSCSALVACSGEGDSNSQEPTRTPRYGSIALALSSVPEDASCLSVSFHGKRSETELIDLTPGEEASYRIDRVPVGLVAVDAQAFAESCASVGSASVPTFLMSAPVVARVRPGAVTRIALTLVRNGRVMVDVSFEEGGPPDSGASTFAVIGDTPYGAEQVAAFPSLVQAINESGDLAGVVHVGDIKNGSSLCDTSYYEQIYGNVSEFDFPFYYTPGDNEWTDCHRANNGAYDPIERLEILRGVFFSNPGTTAGQPVSVLSQAAIPDHATFVENQMWIHSSVLFSAVHVVGSSNGYAPWFGTDTTGTLFDDPERRIAEVEARIAAALDWIDRTFDLAEMDDAPGVALFMQADTFQGTTQGFVEVITRIADRSRAFEKPVLLVQGDSHTYVVDQPLLGGNAAYGIAESVPNLTRLVVEGETASEWLELTVDAANPDVFTWERVFLDEGEEEPGAGTLRVNELSSTPNPDWVEFINPGTEPIDLSGWYFTDNDPTHVYSFESGTTVGPAALLVLDEDVHFTFGFGNGDAIVLYDAAGTLVDEFTYPSHISSSGRCPDGSGPFVAMAPSKGSPNTCP